MSADVTVYRRPLGEGIIGSCRVLDPVTPGPAGGDRTDSGRGPVLGGAIAPGPADEMGSMSRMLGQPGGGRWHGCAVLGSAEQGWQALSGFLQDGLRHGKRVVLAGLAVDGWAALQRRLSEDCVDTDAPMADGRIVLMPEDVSGRMVTLPAGDLFAAVAEQVRQSVADGYAAVRLGGIYPGVGIGPYEGVLNDLVRAVPLEVLCGYDRASLTFDEVQAVRRLHTGEVPDDAEYDDGVLRITRPRAGWVRLAGRWERGTHDAAFAVVADAAAAGDRNVDASSLRYVDPACLHGLLTGISGGLRLQRPNHLIRGLAGMLATKSSGEPAAGPEQDPSLRMAPNRRTGKDRAAGAAADR